MAEQPAVGDEEPEALGYANVALMLDEMTMAAMERERDVMRDSHVDATIRRRLTDGLSHAVALGAHELRWRPIRKDAARYGIRLNVSALADLDSWAAQWGYDREVVAATLLSDEQCKPFEVAARERHLGYGNAANEVRREPGRGCDNRIVAVHPILDIAGEASTDPGHMPSNHLARRAIDEEDLLLWSRLFGPAVQEVARAETERGLSGAARSGVFRSFSKLARRVGGERLEAACSRAIRTGDPRLHRVRNVLDRGLEFSDPAALMPPNTIALTNENVRGSEYFAGE